MIIEGGTGNGFKAKVDDHNKLMTRAVVSTELGYHSEEDGAAFSWTASADINATDSILWLRNDDPNRNLIVENVSVSSDAASSWFVYCPVNVTPDGTVVTGVNLNRTSGNVALATCHRDNTTAVLANYIYYGHNAAASTAIVQLRGALVLGYLQCVAIDITTEPALAQASILGWYSPIQ